MRRFLGYLAFMTAWLVLPGVVTVSIVYGLRDGIRSAFQFWPMWVITVWAAALLCGQTDTK
jgi:hypothetical protein